MNLRRVILCLVPLLPVLAAEIFSYKWMNPAKSALPYQRPVFVPPLENKSFELDRDQYDEVKGELMCNGGWIGKQAGEGMPSTSLVWIEWDRTSSRNTLEAFRHMPEQCLGSIGMKLERSYPRRVYGSGEQQLVFDTTLFRPLRGGTSMFVYKAVWISGLVGADIRENVLATNYMDLGALRFAAATHRFNPEHTRVLMAGVSGLPSEELAWKSFSRKILPQIQWTTVAPTSHLLK